MQFKNQFLNLAETKTVNRNKSMVVVKSNAGISITIRKMFGQIGHLKVIGRAFFLNLENQ